MNPYPQYLEWNEQEDLFGRRYFIGQGAHNKEWHVCRFSKNINDRYEKIAHTFVCKNRAYEFYNCLIEADRDIERQITNHKNEIESYKKAGMLQ